MTGMSLISANNLTKYFGAEEIFSGLSFDVHAGEKIALVGVNGCGKSTLLEILAGDLLPDDGDVHRARSVRIGYLPQTPDFDREGTLWEAMRAVFQSLLDQQAEMRRLEEVMASATDGEREAAMERYGQLLDTFEREGGFTYEARIGQVLSGLGFHEDEVHAPVAYLSGGEKTRALLARLLLEEPDLLLLDEPTNHLDLEGIEWLEDHLKGWKGAIVVVAHDRAFLDTIAERVWEMSFGAMEFYKGNYSAYAAQRVERRAQQLAAYEAQQAKIERTEAYIRRYMAGQRSAQAKGRLKRLERVERLAHPQEEATINIDLGTTVRSGDLVLRLQNLEAGYEPGEPLATVAEAEIRRGHRVALLGPNGSGKTTLLRTIMHQIPPLAGRLRLGSGVRIGYFAQVQEHLAPEHTVLDTLLDAGMDSIAETRSFLARYAFRGDDVFKTVGVLSGGEKARVALAVLALQRANFLLLDEPTNHLDIASQEILQEVLLSFDGTILMVSHDRYLIREVATQVWAIAGSDVHIFPHGYADYAEWHRTLKVPPTEDQAAADEARARHDAERRAQRERERALARQQERIAELEEEIAQLELEMQRLSAALEAAGRSQDVSRVSKLGAQYHEAEARMNHMLEEWAEVADMPV